VTAAQTKLGIVAGAGEMPLRIVQACERMERPLFVVAVDEFAAPLPPSLPHVRLRISKIGACIAALKAQGCTEVVFAGKLERPNGTTVKLRPDFGGVMFLIRLLGNLGRSNDALHRAIASQFGSHGLRVVSPLDVAPELGAKRGCLTRTRPAQAMQVSFGQALKLAREHGAAKREQAVVVRNGQVVAREERAGTDAMLIGLAGRNLTDAVLVKAMMPRQLPTIDPPAIGESTVVHAARAGLAGILIEAGRSVIVDEERVRARADDLGLFVYAQAIEP
jgi:hypothetical protein